MHITLEKTIHEEMFLTFVFGKTPQDFHSAIRIALSPIEYQILAIAGVPTYKTDTTHCSLEHCIYYIN
ncbi:hypothetical protein ABE42_39540 [Bacillus thuringiensis]|nr:hypothetical protein [Bacillus thuringiensis]